MLAYRYTVLSYARGFVFVHPKDIPTRAVSDRAATVQMYRFIPARSDFNAVAQRRLVWDAGSARHHRLLDDVLPTRKKRADSHWRFSKRLIQASSRGLQRGSRYMLELSQN